MNLESVERPVIQAPLMEGLAPTLIGGVEVTKNSEREVYFTQLLENAVLGEGFNQLTRKEKATILLEHAKDHYPDTSLQEVIDFLAPVSAALGDTQEQ